MSGVSRIWNRIVIRAKVIRSRRRSIGGRCFRMVVRVRRVFIRLLLLGSLLKMVFIIRRW